MTISTLRRPFGRVMVSQALNAAKVATFGVQDASNVIIHYSLARNAATALSFKLEVMSDTGVWRELDKISTSSSVATKFSPVTISGISADVAGALPRIPIAGKNMRVTVSATSGGTTDLMTLEVELEY